MASYWREKSSARSALSILTEPELVWRTGHLQAF